MRTDSQSRPRLPSASLGLGVDIIDIFGQSIRYCAQKLDKEPEEIMNLLYQDDPGVNSAFRYALAIQLCRYLESLGNTCKCIYIFGSSVKETAGSASDIDIILWVNRKADELLFLLAKLNLLVSKYYRALMGDRAGEMQRMLDIKIVDEQDIRERKGYGSVVTSIHTSPIRIYEKANS